MVDLDYDGEIVQEKDIEKSIFQRKESMNSRNRVGLSNVLSSRVDVRLFLNQES